MCILRIDQVLVMKITYQKEYKVVVVIEVDDEEEGGVLVKLMPLVVFPMEMKEEEDEVGKLE